MNLSATALEDFAGALSSGRPVDFQTAFGMARLASEDAEAVSARTGVKFSGPPEAEDFLIGEFLDRRSVVDADRAVRMTAADSDGYDRDVSDSAFAYAGMSEGDVRKMQFDSAAGDNTASVRLAHKFYFG